MAVRGLKMVRNNKSESSTFGPFLNCSRQMAIESESYCTSRGKDFVFTYRIAIFLHQISNGLKPKNLGIW